MSTTSIVMKESLLFVTKQVPGVKMVAELVETVDKIGKERTLENLKETQEAISEEITDIRRKLDEALRSGTAQRQMILDLHKRQEELMERLLDIQDKQQAGPRQINQEEQKIIEAVATLHQLQASTRERLAAMNIMLESNSLALLNLISPNNREIMSQAPGSYGDIVEAPKRGKINLLLPTKEILAIPPATFEHLCNKREETDISGEATGTNLLIRDRNLRGNRIPTETASFKPDLPPIPRIEPNMDWDNRLTSPPLIEGEASWQQGPLSTPSTTPQSSFTNIRTDSLSEKIGGSIALVGTIVTGIILLFNGPCDIKNNNSKTREPQNNTREREEVELSDEEAERLAKIPAYVDISLVTTLSDSAAKHLSKHKGELWFGRGLTTLSDTAALYLARHQGPLYLRGLTTLSDTAARHLAQHGEIYTNPTIQAQIDKFR